MMESIKSKLDHLIERQKIIASNIANANTPGFKTKDIEEFSFDKMRRKLELRKTDQQHLSSRKNGKFRTIQVENEHMKIDGNNVSLEDQTIQSKKNDLDHQKMVHIYNKLSSLARMAGQSERKG